jgi:hypothetical protein
VAAEAAVDTLVPDTGGGEPTVTDGELSLCRLWIGFESSMGVEGGEKQNE